MITLNSIAKSESNIKEVRSKKKEEADASGLMAKTSSSGTSSPGPSLSANESDCRNLRNQITASRSLFDSDSFSYVRLTLLDPKKDDFNGQVSDRWAINMDFSVNSENRFNKFKWRVTNRRREFYTNIPLNWEHDMCYGQAWDFYNELTMTKWIGKACYRLNVKDGTQKLKLVPFTAMVLWSDGTDMFYKFWFENAEVQGKFDIPTTSKHFLASSEPIKNFKPQGFQLFKV